MTEERDRLKYKLYNAASSGMPLSLYTALAEMDPNEANQLLNEVNSKHGIFFRFFFVHRSNPSLFQKTAVFSVVFV